MGNCITEHYKAECSGKPMDELLKHNGEYKKSREKYHGLLQQVREKLEGSDPDDRLWLRLDDAVGEYSASYGDTAYMLGFHDGMEVGQEHKNIAGMYGQEKGTAGITLKDMADLIAMYDTQVTADKVLCLTTGEETISALEYTGGGLCGNYFRLERIIERNCSDKIRNAEMCRGMPAWSVILMNRELTAEDRAAILLGKGNR